MRRDFWSHVSSSSMHTAMLAAVQQLPSWWKKIDNDPAWQSGVFFVLAGLYAIIALVALGQLIRIQHRVPEYGWTTQKMFHLLNTIVSVVRMTVFVLREPIANLQWVALQSVLLDLPALLFTTTYTLLVLFWAEIYHQARTLPTNNLRPTFIIFNVCVYVVQVVIWVIILMSPPESKRLAASLSAAFMGLISLVAAFGFMLYGGRLFLMLRSFPIDSRGRRKKIQEVGFVTTICTFCFIVRSGMVFFAALDPRDGSLNVMNHPILNFVYYLLVELIPSALVLYILRKLPPKRSNQGYQNIPAN